MNYLVSSFNISLLFILSSSCNKVTSTESFLTSESVNVVVGVIGEIEFIEKTIDWGDVFEGDTIIARFYFKNTGINELIIEYVKPDCICTDFYVDKYKLDQGEEGEIVLVLNTQNKFGYQRVYAVVKANTKNKFHRLLLKVNVQQKEGLII